MTHPETMLMTDEINHPTITVQFFNFAQSVTLSIFFKLLTSMNTGLCDYVTVKAIDFVVLHLQLLYFHYVQDFDRQDVVYLLREKNDLHLAGHVMKV